MALSKSFPTELGINGQIANIEEVVYLADSATVQVKVGVYFDQAHFEAENSKPFWFYQSSFDCLFDAGSNVPMILQAEADLISRFDPFIGAEQI